MSSIDLLNFEFGSYLVQTDEKDTFVIYSDYARKAHESLYLYGDTYWLRAESPQLKMMFEADVKTFIAGGLMPLITDISNSMSKTKLVLNKSKTQLVLYVDTTPIRTAREICFRRVPYPVPATLHRA